LSFPSAVRLGDLKRFEDVLKSYGRLFQKDHTYTLILRLRHNVIKTAVRSIGLSYSRISLVDITKKLMLESPEEAEFIIAKVVCLGEVDDTGTKSIFVRLGRLLEMV
jgi:26S proteasome regulatory subunit N3